MKIIRMTANPSGAWPPIQEGAFDAIPEGHALVPDSLTSQPFMPPWALSSQPLARWGKPTRCRPIWQ